MGWAAYVKECHECGESQSAIKSLHHQGAKTCDNCGTVVCGKCIDTGAVRKHRYRVDAVGTAGTDYTKCPDCGEWLDELGRPEEPKGLDTCDVPDEDEKARYGRQLSVEALATKTDEITEVSMKRGAGKIDALLSFDEEWDVTDVKRFLDENGVDVADVLRVNENKGGSMDGKYIAPIEL